MLFAAGTLSALIGLVVAATVQHGLIAKLFLAVSLLLLAISIATCVAIWRENRVGLGRTGVSRNAAFPALGGGSTDKNVIALTVEKRPNVRD
jgi:hypothetical protein